MADEKRFDRPDNDPPKPDRAKPEELRDWETLQDNGEEDKTERLMIGGGWLYRTTTAAGVAMVYVAGDLRL